MLKITDHKIIYIGILALLMMVSGFWLSRSGKPYNGVIFTIHKLLVLVFIVLTFISIRKLVFNLDINSLQTATLIITTAIVLIAFVSGVLLSFKGEAPAFVLKIHKLTPYLVIISVIYSFWFLFKMELKG